MICELRMNQNLFEMFLFSESKGGWGGGLLKQVFGVGRNFKSIKSICQIAIYCDQTMGGVVKSVLGGFLFVPLD